MKPNWMDKSPWLDKEQIAESLSRVALTEIIGVVLDAIKSSVENLMDCSHKWSCDIIKKWT